MDVEFASTQELSGAQDFVGQDRALAALELGLGVSGTGYNIFVSGLPGAKNWKRSAVGWRNTQPKLLPLAIGSMFITLRILTRRVPFTCKRDRAAG